MARNNARRILPRFFALGLLVLVLAGCVRFQADLTLTPENTVSGSVIVAVILTDETDETREGTLTAAEQIATGLLGDLATAPGVTTVEYEQDSYLGQRLDFENVPLTAFSGTEPDSLHFERDGDEYVFSGAIDFSGESTGGAGAEDDGNLTVKITFPGTVTETDGTVDGTTVSWSTAIDQRLEMNARGAATPPGPPLALIIGIAAAVLLAVAVVVVILVLRGRRKAAAAAAAGTAPATLDPAFAALPAVASEVPGAPTPPAVVPPAATSPKAATPPKAPKPPKAATTPPADSKATAQPKAPAAPKAPAEPKAPKAPKAPAAPKTPPAPDA